MDPNACLAEIRTVITDFKGYDRDAALRLAELVDALDDWLTSGGFLPNVWQPRPSAARRPARLVTGTCGCGEPGVLVQMTDRLWEEFFAVAGAERPTNVAGCVTCMADWLRYAAPILPVRSREVTA